MLSPPRFPRHLRWLNRADRGLRRLGLALLPFEPAALLERAAKLAGLSDYADDATFREALAVLCDSAERDARLSLVGRRVMQDYFTRSLVGRLRFVEAQKSAPDVARTELAAPLVVIGLPRSGTTLLHHLLSLHPEARPLRFWELMEPIAPPGPDRRREQLARQLADMKRFDRGLDGKHHFDADNPEECMLLLDSTLLSLSFYVFSPVYGYVEWLRRQDHRGPYRAYRWYLQLFQRASPGRRLTLKAPAHTAAVAELLEAVPGARLVQTHRDPGEVVPSLNSLLYSLHALVSDRIDLPRATESAAAHLEHLIERNEAARAAGAKIVDVQYERLVRDPVACVREVYDRLGEAWSPEHGERIEAFMKARPKGRFGGHEYAAEDFGTTRAAIRERFAAYAARRVEGAPGE
jgi:LPS sulfotransferase NodH